MIDLISRADALKPFCITPDGARIPEVDCDNFPVEFSVKFIKKHLLSLPSVEPTAEEVWSVAQKVFDSTLTYREAIDYLKEVEKQHKRFLNGKKEE